MYAEWFRQHGCVTLQADSASDGYRLAVELSPDVAIVDVSLRGVESGLDLTRRLKQTGATAAVPVIILSGHVFPTDRKAARRAGCDMFVPKPCDPGMLARAVEQLMTVVWLGPAESRIPESG
jgi:CheY-like chemotaxis protein